MTSIRPEVDSLMWAVAEQGDIQAISDFRRRFPSHGSELDKRIQMVQRLKASKFLASDTTPIFRPTIKPSVPFRADWVVAGLALAAIAAASFSITQSIFGSSDALKPNTRGANMFNPQPRLLCGERPDGKIILRHDPISGDMPFEPVPVGTTPIAASQTISVHVELARLVDVLRKVSNQGGLRAQIPPDMPNPEIRADYDNMTPKDIIGALGRLYGFTSFEEGDGSLLVIPAVDQKKGEGGINEIGS